MKKVVALFLCLLLFSVCVSAFAEGQTVTLPESSNSFRAELTLPDGASFENNAAQDGYSLCTVKKDGLADIHIIIAFDELVAGLSLAEMTDEQLDELAALTSEDGTTPAAYQKITAENGQPYLFIETMEGGVLNNYLTVHESHIVTLTQYRDEFEPLTEADCELMLLTLAGLRFLPET